MLSLMQGIWYSTEDTLAWISIQNNKWVSHYTFDKQLTPDTSIINFVKNPVNYIEKSVKADFFVLTNKSDSSYYEIMGLSDSIFSIMYYPRMKLHKFQKQKQILFNNQ